MKENAAFAVRCVCKHQEETHIEGQPAGSWGKQKGEREA